MRTLRWGCRLGLAMTAVWVWVTVSAPGSWAAVLADGSGTAPPYRSPGLAWIELTDQRGISIWQYGLSINHGGITDPKAFIWSQVVDQPYSLYVNFAGAAIWFLDWTMSFEWVRMLSGPLTDLGAHMQTLLDRIGAVNTFLMLSAAVAGLWMFRGRNVTAIWEVGSSMVIAALAVGVLASPVKMIAGESGLLMQAREAGLGFVASVQGEDHATSRSETARNELTSQLITTFVRVPTQLINFGVVLDGGPCEGVYDGVVKAGPYKQEDSTIRDKVGECSKPAGEWADDPGVGMAAGAWTLYPSGGWALILCALGGGAVLAAGLQAMYQGLKLIITTLTGLLPGGGRGSFFLTLSDLFVVLGIVLYTIFFFALFLQLVAGLFAASEGEQVPKTFVVVDIVMIVGVGIYLREKKRIQNSARRLAEWMAQRPGASATALPQRLSSGLASTAGGVANTAIRLGTLRATRAAARNRGSGGMLILGGGHAGSTDGGRPGHGTLPDQDLRPPAHHPSSMPALPGGHSGVASEQDGPSQPGPDGPTDSPGGGLARIQDRKRRGGMAGTLVRVGAEAVAAQATGGASTAALAALRAGRTVHSARRAVLNAQLTSVRDSPRASSDGASSPRSEVVRGEVVAGARARAIASSTTAPSAPGDAGRVSPTSTRPSRSTSTPASAGGMTRAQRPARAASRASGNAAPSGPVTADRRSTPTPSPVSSPRGAVAARPAGTTSRPTHPVPETAEQQAPQGAPGGIVRGSGSAQRPARPARAAAASSSSTPTRPRGEDRRAADRAAAKQDREARRLERLRQEEALRRASGRRGPTA